MYFILIFCINFTYRISNDFFCMLEITDVHGGNILPQMYSSTLHSQMVAKRWELRKGNSGYCNYIEIHIYVFKGNCQDVECITACLLTGSLWRDMN